MANLDIVGSVAVDVVPIVPNFHEKLKAIVLPIADRVGREAGEHMGDAISNNIVVAIPQAIQRGGAAATRVAGRQGDDAGGAFARSIRRKLEIAFKAMPKLDVRLSDTGVDAELARIRAKLEQLSGKRVGVDIDAATAGAQVERLEEELRRLGAAHPNVTVRADTAVARAALAEIREQIAEISAVPGRVRLETDGAFGAKLRAVVEQAKASLPEINVDADTSPARAEIQSLRAQLDALSDQRVGIDVDAGAALARINEVQARLSALSATTAEVDVRADTSRAAAQLAALQAMADNQRTFRIEAFADTSQATNALLHLAIQAAVLTTIPIGPVLTAGLGAVVSMATAAGGALGAFGLASIPAIKGVTTALEAQKAAQEDTTKSTSAGANAGVQAQQRALQMAAAQQQLASAHRQASSAIAAANDGVVRAERSLADAQKAELKAQQDLTTARKTAAEQLRDLDDQLTNGALDQREATLRVQEAEIRLDEVRRDPRSTQLQIDQAQLAADQAKQHVQEQLRDYKDLQEAADRQRKAGVEGSDVVRQAQDRVAQAQQNTRDQSDALVKAQKAVAEAHLQAADAIKTAERGIASARLASSKATTTAVSKADELRAALDKLTPTQRALYDSIAGPSGIKKAFSEWSKELQPQTLPLFTRSVDAAKNSLPGLTGLVLAAARGIGVLMDKASAEMKSPFWVRFKGGIKESAEPALVGLGVAVGNIFKGIAGIVDAFLPHMDGIAAKSDSITGRFANWGTRLKGSPDFERFLSYVKENAPPLAEFIGKVLSGLLDFSKAIAPVSQTMFATLGPLFAAVSWLSTNMPGLVQYLWGLYFASKAISLGMAAFGVAMGIYNTVVALASLETFTWAAALAATGIVPLIVAIAVVIGLLVAGVIWAYKNVGWFHTAVDVAWSGIKAATLFLWDNVLKPAFVGIWNLLKGVGAVAMWLWENAIGPAFSFIWAAAKILFTIVAVGVLTPLYMLFKAVGWVALWLWENALGPIFGWIGEKAIWLYENGVKPAFRGFMDQLSALGHAARWLWDNFISPIFSWIGDKAAWLYREGVKPHIDRLSSLLDSLSDGFSSTKDNIKRAWDQIKDITKGPVEFVANIVYNKGILPVWNAVAGITGVEKLSEFKGFHTGGIASGYSPGRDDRLIAVGGGEAIMRPEWTRAIGADRIHAWNAAARSGGVSGVQRAISAGMPAYKDGGIVDWLKDKGSRVGSVLKGGWDALSDPGALFDEVTGGVKDKLKSLASNRFAQAVGKMPLKMLEGLKAKATEWLSFGGADGGLWSRPVDAATGTPFGQAGGMWASGRHTGLDFPAAIGTLVRAVAGGKVSMATGGGPYGNHVMINHGGGLTSLYAHLSEIMTRVGQSVRQGDVIGKVGDTGNVTGPHLHLEARLNGTAVDPMTYLSGGGGKGGASVERWRAVVQHSLALLGQPTSLADTTLRRMDQESGGNPTAVNLWDSNARAGTPSVGLMQVIRPTFDAYAGYLREVGPKMYGVSVDPLANVFSSMRYALSRYGSLSSAYNRPGGYAAGGFPGIGELAWVGEQGPELVRFLSPAQVYNNRDSMAMARQASSLKGLSPAGGGTAPVNLVAHVYVGDREITDIVDVRIEHRDSLAVDQLNTGRRL